MTQPLHGVRVVELAEGIAGPYAGKLLADYGAEVWKVEPPAGDLSRRLGPFPADAPEAGDPERSALFLHLNTNKRSIVADSLDDERVLALIAAADVVIEAGQVPFGELVARRPGLVVLSVTSFGLSGPYAGYKGSEIIHYAIGGPMSATGKPDREPIKMGADLGQYECGSVGALAVLAALSVAERSGEGVHIDLANVETQVGSIDRRMTYLLYGTYRGQDVPRFGGYSVSPLPGGVRPAGDGHIQVSTLPNWIPRALKVLADPDLAERYANPGFIFDPELPGLADAALLTWSVTRSKQEAMEEAQAAAWPVTAVNLPRDVLADRHLAERGFFVATDRAILPGPPIRMEDGWALQREAPTLGADDGAVLPAARPRPRPSGDASRGTRLPLEGVRVLDLTVVWAGPYATMFLGDLGADVVRVDNPWVFPSATRGVLARPPKMLVDIIGGIFGGYPDAEPGERPWNRVALFNAHARNKRSVTLDLRKELGREMFLRLVEQSDVLIENNSVDLLDKLGLDWPTLSARNPRLIAIRMPSVGLEGPYRNYLGFGVNFEGLCGLTALRGYRDLDVSENEAVFHMDAATGSAGAFAALAALRRRERTGRGELIELSQSENMLSHIGELLIEAAWNGTEHRPLGNRDRVRAPQGAYRCAGEDAWVAISIGDDAEWSALAALIGAPGLADLPRAERQDRHDELDELIGRWAEPLTPTDAFHRCQAAGVPAAPVLHERESLVDPHFRARGLFRPNGSADTGTHEYPTHAWRWSGPPLRWDPLPVLGGNNEEVFRGLLGVSDEEWARLAADGHLSPNYLAPDGTSL